MWLQFWERRKVPHSAFFLTPVPHSLWPECVEMCEQRNRKLNYKLLMKLQFLIVLWKQWKVQWVTSTGLCIVVPRVQHVRLWKGWDASCQAFGVDRHSSLALCSLKQLLARLVRCQQAQHKDCQGTTQNSTGWITECWNGGDLQEHLPAGCPQGWPCWWTNTYPTMKGYLISEPHAQFMQLDVRKVTEETSPSHAFSGKVEVQNEFQVWHCLS